MKLKKMLLLDDLIVFWDEYSISRAYPMHETVVTHSVWKTGLKYSYYGVGGLEGYCSAIIGDPDVPRYFGSDNHEQVENETYIVQKKIALVLAYVSLSMVFQKSIRSRWLRFEWGREMRRHRSNTISQLKRSFTEYSFNCEDMEHPYFSHVMLTATANAKSYLSNSAKDIVERLALGSRDQKYSTDIMRDVRTWLEEALAMKEWKSQANQTDDAIAKDVLACLEKLTKHLKWKANGESHSKINKILGISTVHYADLIAGLIILVSHVTGKDIAWAA